MLVLTRKADEAVRIGREIQVTILSVHGNQVRIGIEAPAHVDIVRTELDRVSHDGEGGDE